MALYYDISIAMWWHVANKEVKCHHLIISIIGMCPGQMLHSPYFLCKTQLARWVSLERLRTTPAAAWQSLANVSHINVAEWRHRLIKALFDCRIIPSPCTLRTNRKCSPYPYSDPNPNSNPTPDTNHNPNNWITNSLSHFCDCYSIKISEQSHPLRFRSQNDVFCFLLLLINE